ncbi:MULTISPECIES: transcription antitermination factor NusB [Auritidibacter]|uniref:transcription antitermination factor NusB n=1 Tax=Auritidibacter TaxID=1160973 RepID=UPI000D7381F9|nr:MULTISPECIES: transcription antitermination factor NusB [Auritidibacter]PXA81248.1 transcription antitermination factor NusB [Auritidibacter sp. NML120779]AXR73621.1 transcription antitermination factor NusB [Auritidibacter sp. NML130574]NIH70535.1 N utilization substance protein B [Auritidibacter ignavus]PXA77888.1 transcription antitermination factor NusB [Auritidibacter sp. NML100628]PXA81454.1 transcription antitermination factor NusB [Auritidibacter sp. NML120636]
MRTSSRGRARRRAVEIIFEAEQRHSTPLAALQARRQYTDQIINPYTAEIVDGVITEYDRIDEILATYTQGWSMDRMPAFDRATLRVGTWELLFNDDVPDAVAVSEATTIAKEYSTDESPDFVNGLLGRIQQVKPTLVL